MPGKFSRGFRRNTVCCIAALTIGLLSAPADPSVPAAALTVDATNWSLEMPQWIPAKPNTNAARLNPADFFAATNVPLSSLSGAELVAHLRQRLELARYFRTARQPEDAAPILIELLGDDSPEPIRQAALLELAAVAQDQNDLSRSQQVYAQFLSKWPYDARVPEIFLRQGLLFRQMGLYDMAFTKFYGVMTTALALKNDRMDYYARVVLQAQTEIAETHYQLGRYAEAADFFSRLLRLDNPSIKKSELLFKLVRCQAATGQHAEAVASAQDFLLRYPDAPEKPEVRFHLATSLKELGRNNESLREVLKLLQEQREQTKGRPEVWAYWQQRAGNLIANQLYREGDYAKALEVYTGLTQLDPSPAWQVPVLYQIGLTYERLSQPDKASETYSAILQREQQTGTNATPSLKAVFDMARWRGEFIQWQKKAEAANRQIQAEAEASARAPKRSPAALDPL